VTNTRVRPHVARVLQQTEALLFAFHGTICDLDPGGDMTAITDRIRDRLFARGRRMSLLLGIETDPRSLVWHAHRVSPAKGAAAERILRDAEIAAAATAVPTPGAHEALHAAHASSRHVAIVGDTSTTAMEKYLDIHGVLHLVGPIVGREARHPTSNEPGVALTRKAIQALGFPPSACALVSLNAHGMYVAAEAGIHAIGVVNEHAKRKHLAGDGRAVVVSSLPHLAAALTAVPR
jgi:beta-phosphoglucomutase-like phosphatase (HAD superfamily)